jgi:hypothetical protein
MRIQTIAMGKTSEDIWWIPLWPLVLTFSIGFAAIANKDRRLNRRARIGRCLVCNYNRTGLAATTPCPECGAPVPVLPTARS